MKRLVLLAALVAFAFTASAQMKISGTVRYTDGTPAQGVTVSDGFSCTQTAKNGTYKLQTSSDAFHVFYTIPADCKINVKDGHPDFYCKLDKSVKKYDFTLEKLQGGAQKRFKVIMMADPQAQCMFHLKRFQRETVPDLRAMADSFDVPYFGMTLGDMGYSEGKHDATGMMPMMREAMSYEHTHCLFFQTIGNHDNAFAPVQTDAHSSTFNLAYQRPFEECFGPVNYSFDRGDVHFVSMKDIQYRSAEASNKYDPAFTDEQMEWLRQDVKNVSREKMIVLCCHVGIYNRTNQNLENMRLLLKEFKEAHIMIGHTHFMNNNVNNKGTYEHVHAAASGAFWWSTINGDGVPNGYTVYDFDGTAITNWQYKCTGRDISDQMRLYRGDAEFGGEYEKIAFPYSHDTILANVYMADPNWTIELWEDGEKTALFKRIVSKKTLEPAPDSSQDWWAIAYHLGVIGRSHGDRKDGPSKWVGGGRKGYTAGCNHMFKAVLRNPDAKQIKVVAKDPFGNVYTCDRFTTDYSECALTNELRKISRSKLDKTY